VLQGNTLSATRNTEKTTGRTTGVERRQGSNTTGAGGATTPKTSKGYF